MSSLTCSSLTAAILATTGKVGRTVSFEVLHEYSLKLPNNLLSCAKMPAAKESDSILASSLAGEIARSRLKRRQRYRWAGLLRFEKARLNQDADSFRCGGRQYPRTLSIVIFLGFELTSTAAANFISLCPRGCFLSPNAKKHHPARTPAVLHSRTGPRLFDSTGIYR